MSVAQVFSCPYAKTGTQCERGENNPLASRLVLQNHIRSVHQARQWTCPVLGCEKAQKDFANYRRHMKLVHCRDVRGEVLPDNMKITMCVGCQKHDFRTDNIRRHSENCAQAQNHKAEHGGTLVVPSTLGARRQAGWAETEVVLIPGAVAAALLVAAERVELLPAVAPVAAVAARRGAAATTPLSPPLTVPEDENRSFSSMLEDQTPFEPLAFVDYGDPSLFDMFAGVPLPELSKDPVPPPCPALPSSGCIDPALLMNEPWSSPFVPSFPGLLTPEEAISQEPILGLLSALQSEQTDHTIAPVYDQWHSEYDLL